MRKWTWHKSANGLLACYGREQVFTLDPDRGELTEVRLYPGSDIILGGIGSLRGPLLGWGRFNAQRDVETEAVLTRSDGHGLAIEFTALDKADRDCRYTTRMKVAHDPGRDSYVFTFHKTLEVLDTHALRWGPYGDIYEGLEFLNFFPSGIFDDRGAGPLDDQGRILLRSWRGAERYRGWVFQNAGKEWECMPLNHIVSSPSYARKVCRNSRWLLVGESDRVPTVQLLGETWRHAHVGLCHWMYDTHFNYLPRVNPLPRGTKIEARFRIFNTTVDSAERIRRRSRSAPIGAKERRATNFPASTESGLDLFTEGVGHGRYDPHRFWRPYIPDARGTAHHYRDRSFVLGDNCIQRYRIPRVTGVVFGWNRSAPSRSGGFAFVRTAQAEQCGWELSALPYVPGRGYQVTAWIRTRALRGRGATLAVRPWYRREFRCARTWVSGDSEWTRVSLKLTRLRCNNVEMHGHLFDYNFLDLRFHLEGTGEACVAEVRYNVTD